MATPFINVVKLGKDLRAINKRIAKAEEVATNRSLNIIAKRAKKMIVNDVFEDTGISKGTAGRRIEIDNATRNKPQARLLISAARVTYPSPRRLGPKGKRSTGISFIGSGKKRRKVTDRVKGKGGLGSKPFIIKGKSSKKKLPVYVGAPFLSAKTSTGRRVHAMYFSSLAHVARKDWQQKVNDFAIKEIKKELPKQLKSASKGF